MIRSVRNNQSQLATVAFGVLVVCAVLDLNWVLGVATGITQVVSGLYLLTVIILITQSRCIALNSRVVVALCASLIAYIWFGAFFSATFQGYVPENYVPQYLNGVLIILAVSSFVIAASPSDLQRSVRIFKYALLLSTVATIATPLFGFYLQTQDRLDTLTGRSFGLFENPNDAGFAAVFALVFVLICPARNKLAQITETILPLIACAASMSRAAIIALIGVALIYLVYKGRISMLAALGIGLGVAVTQGVPQLVTGAVVDPGQMNRLDEMIQFFSGQLNENSTGHRFTLWAIGLERIEREFPLGGGLGTLHFMPGGVLVNGIWQGVHNSYLMILGESGLLPFLMFVFALLLWLRAALQRNTQWYQLACFFALQCILMTAHNTLSIRFVNLVIGFMLGLLARVSIRSQIMHTRSVAKRDPGTLLIRSLNRRGEK
jgi:O-antigen ligase